jgi:hypothetical protein
LGVYISEGREGEVLELSQINDIKRGELPRDARNVITVKRFIIIIIIDVCVFIIVIIIIIIIINFICSSSSSSPTSSS